MNKTTTPVRKSQPRSLRLCTIGTADVLWLTVGKLTTAYKLTRLPSDFGTAFCLEKAQQGDGPEDHYDVLLDVACTSCECLGNLRWNRCKHVESLQALVKQGKI